VLISRLVTLRLRQGFKMTFAVGALFDVRLHSSPAVAVVAACAPGQLTLHVWGCSDQVSGLPAVALWERSRAGGGPPPPPLPAHRAVARLSHITRGTRAFHTSHTFPSLCIHARLHAPPMISVTIVTLDHPQAFQTEPNLVRAVSNFQTAFNRLVSAPRLDVRPRSPVRFYSSCSVWVV
jgi:hypothetical protein